MKTKSGESVTNIESKNDPKLDEVIKGNEAYPISFNFEFTVGKEEIIERKLNPLIGFQAQHLVSNVRESGLATLIDLRASNVFCLLGDGLDLNATPDLKDPILGVPISFPVVSPANMFTLSVHYSGRVPTWYKEGDKYKVCVTLVGKGIIVW